MELDISASGFLLPRLSPSHPSSLCIYHITLKFFLLLKPPSTPHPLAHHHNSRVKPTLLILDISILDKASLFYYLASVHTFLHKSFRVFKWLSLTSCPRRSVQLDCLIHLQTSLHLGFNLTRLSSVTVHTSSSYFLLLHTLLLLTTSILTDYLQLIHNG